MSRSNNINDIMSFLSSTVALKFGVYKSHKGKMSPLSADRDLFRFNIPAQNSGFESLFILIKREQNVFCSRAEFTFASIFSKKREQNASFILIKREQIFALFASTPFFVREQLHLNIALSRSNILAIS